LDQAESALTVLDFCQPAAFQHLTIRWELPNTQSSCECKKAIHNPQPETSVQLSNRAAGLLKFAYQPNGTWRENGADLADHGFGVAAVENVEEKMSHHKIELAIGQNAGHCVHLMELDAQVICILQFSLFQIDHSGARLQDRNTGLPVILEQSRQESSIAFAQNQHAPSLDGVRKEIEAGVL
jgi:hypothetical protein